ncbi:hypothetical protein QBC37DRAFT_453284 [Rhypophila decipiens]|uniref:DUF3492 domain-containing protein n=1 Tax=Rhypophila decipiens TaxID=261697 RepID=A0AAN6Y2V4_9PEZI|nr:hypothetical protein QBC37DRAFT_453284 [Rhypophila decipiens]
MASFFQPPGSGDPVIIECNSALNSSHRPRLVYCNRLIEPYSRAQTPHQYFTLIVAATCLVVPVSWWIGSVVWRFLRSCRVDRVRKTPATLVKRQPSRSSLPIEHPFLSSAKSFTYISDNLVVGHDGASALLPADLCIVPLSNLRQDPTGDPGFLATEQARPGVLGLVDLATFTGNVLPDSESFVQTRGMDGVVIRFGADAKESEISVLEAVLWKLNDNGIPVILNLDHDCRLLEHISLGLVAGVIVDNACILPNGQRRDYFCSHNLRRIMAICADERARRPGFFIGFHDLWEQQPSAAVICRARKIASHFEAVLNYGPRDGKARGDGRPLPSLSGVEYLRRSEVSQLQQEWVQQKCKVAVNSDGQKVQEPDALLNLDELDSLVEGAKGLLHTSIQFSKLQERPHYETEIIAPPEDGSVVKSGNFWETVDGKHLSTNGCYPLAASPTPRQYEAVVATQEHLRELNMLQDFTPEETEKVVYQLQRHRTCSKHKSLLVALLQGLVQGNVLVYKGLASGFTVPDNVTEFWGVSNYRITEGIVDIFVSRNCPSDIDTIFHTWLAHHDVSREERHEEELLLGEGNTNGTCLPLSMQHAIKSSTPSEILFLLRRLEASTAAHLFRERIYSFCKTVLLEDADLEVMTAAMTSGFLSGSIEMQDLLARRLLGYIQAGTREIPSIDNLVELYQRLEHAINHALFCGDRETLGRLTAVVHDAYEAAKSGDGYIDLTTDLVLMMYFCALRKTALEDVYMEATDHCPVFSQPDQAAVFSELWVLGSQCELYFCMKPRALGKIIYDRHCRFLATLPADSLDTTEDGTPASLGLMSVYAKPEPPKVPSRNDPDDENSETYFRSLVGQCAAAIIQLGALSIFCLPAVVDLVLLTFLGRGLFMTAYMGDENLIACCYGLLIALLISAGVTGWVGSVGNYYLSNFAYHNMIYFHVQRLSGGFMLSLTVGIVGGVVFGCKVSLSSALIFFAYTLLLSTYLNILGIMATMHQKGSPLSSGRIVLWRTMPLLLISPVLSSFINGYDTAIYLGAGYGFLLLVLFQYRKLCHEWMTWLERIPKFTENDILEWYRAQFRRERQSGSTTQLSITSESTVVDAESDSKNSALRAFRKAVMDHHRGLIHRPSSLSSGANELVHQVADALPFIEWVLHSEAPEETRKNEIFSVPWFAQVVEALKKRRLMVQGLKEHSIFMLYRYAQLDIGQNIALFLIFLMDRWVSIIMSTTSAPISVFSDYTSRYAICFAISYFCFSVMLLDSTLQGYWKVTFELSDEKVCSLEEASMVARGWERSRRDKYASALLVLLRRIMLLFGGSTALLWFFVEKAEVLELYYLYALGYSAVVVFQFNRCFTTNARYHVISLLFSAAIGFVTGCILHSIYRDSPPMYLDALALITSSFSAAILTSVWVWNPFSQASHQEQGSPVPDISTEKTVRVFEPNAVRASQIMKHLCLNIDVDAEWTNLPSAVRQAIISRVLHQPVHISKEMKEWMSCNGVSIEHSDIQLRQLVNGRLHEFDGAAANNPSSHRGAPTPRLSLVSAKRNYPVKFWVTMTNIPLSFAKWVAILAAGDAIIERELSYALRHTGPLRNVLPFFLLLVWNLCRCTRNAWLYAFLVFHHKGLMELKHLARHGASRVLCEDRVVVEQSLKKVTGFLSRAEMDNLRLEVFQGALSERPIDSKPKMTAIYDPHYRLLSSEHGEGRKSIRTRYIYEENNKTRVPNSTNVTHWDHNRRTYIYDREGRAVRGTMDFGLSQYTFEFFYHHDSSQVIKAAFRAAEPYCTDTLTVYWGVPLRAKSTSESGWIPSERKSRVEKRFGDQLFVITYDYQHCRDPVIKTTVTDSTGETMDATQAPRLFDHEDLLWQRPSDVLFEYDDLLLHHNIKDIKRAVAMPGRRPSLIALLKPSFWRYRSKKALYRPVSTGWLRTELWNSWRNSEKLDAIAACWMDEFILRHEKTLGKYWAWRDLGQLPRAKQVLDSQIHKIGPAIEIAQDVSEICLLPIKPTDLYSMGLGKDANQVTTRPQDCFDDTADRISVIFNDVGCWPDAPGGVSNCRRDLVNGHSTIRNHVLAESGNEYGIPRFQVEKNVQSLKLVPLWGLDCRTPNHGIIDNLLESEVDDKIASTDTKSDIVGKFIPLLQQFVKGARSKHISRQDLVRYSNVMLDMFKYFEHKDYNKTWKSNEVASAWVTAWLTPYDDADITNPDEYFEIEKPSLSDFRTALAIYTSYFFIFSVQTPEDCPRVFQSTHHGISSLFGMLLKYRRGTTFGIWDHAILWRECCLNISPAQSTLPLSVQSMLLAGMGLAMRLAYFHADVVLPCTSVFNPVWEGDLATDGGRLGHVKTFNRKIDPIVNGVSNMDAFKPVDEVRTTTPTVVMLSNVQFIKDIRTAIFAADVIVNRYGFKDYNLHVYGAQDREPEYAIDMAKLIESSGLSNNVVLKGFGKPQEILKDAWLFMNSSLSEGLPLAVAEAALAAVPVVATAVGATSLILTDPDDASISYGEIVPPNDPTALARAQISILAMAGKWAKFAGDNEKRCALPDVLTKDDVAWIEKRMYDKVEARRHLGMLTRKVVLRGFHGERYLREHEQMYWVQWHLAGMRRDPDVMGEIYRPGAVNGDDDGIGDRVCWVNDENSEEGKNGNNGGENAGEEKEKRKRRSKLRGRLRKEKVDRDSVVMV